MDDLAILINDKITRRGIAKGLVFIQEDLNKNNMQTHKKCGGIRGVFSDCGNGYSFAICGGELLDAFFAGFKQKFSVKGGGRNGMVQGTVFASRPEIENYFK